MGKAAGGFLRILTSLVYVLLFCCAAIGLGIYSYFLAKLSYHHLPIDQKWRAVEGITGAAVLYTIFAILLTCCLGGKTFFALLGILLDILFCGAFIAVAVLTRDGARSCSGSSITTPLGTGPSNAQRAGTGVGYACRLNTAVFAVSVAAALLFLISALLQIFLLKHHQKEKKYGPSPKNDYTSGSGKRKFWQRKEKPTKDVYDNHELGHNGTNGTTPYTTTGVTGTNGTTGGMHPHHPTNNNNITTESPGYTGTVPGAGHGNAEHFGTHKYEAPQGNPYGYSNNNATHPTGTAVNY